MIFGKITTYGAAFTLCGDYQDLLTLYKTIGYLAEENSHTPKLDEYILGLGYDVRHAYQGDRKTGETVEVSSNQNNRTISIYLGCDILLPVFIVQLAIMRRKAAFKPTTRQIQANLYALESALEEALSTMDENISKFCLKWLEQSGFLFTEDYYLNFTQTLTYDYVHDVTGKKRIQQLPDILQRMFVIKEYEIFVKDMNAAAIKQGCSPHDVDDGRKWNDAIKW